MREAPKISQSEHWIRGVSITLQEASFPVAFLLEPVSKMRNCCTWIIGKAKLLAKGTLLSRPAFCVLIPRKSRHFHLKCDQYVKLVMWPEKVNSVDWTSIKLFMKIDIKRPSSPNFWRLWAHLSYKKINVKSLKLKKK